MDRRRRQYVPMSVYLAHGKNGQKLLGKFGLEGLAVWAAFLCACKTNWIQGQFTYAGEPDGWSKLGLYGYEPSFSLDEFFAYTGALKQTRKRRSGRVTDIVCTQWEAWNVEIDRELDADKKSRKRGHNASTKPGRNGDDTATLGGTEVEDEDENARARDPGNGSLPREELVTMGLLKAVQ